MGHHLTKLPKTIDSKNHIFFRHDDTPLNLEGFYSGQSIFLICNGPSINNMNLVPLDSRMTFGINNGGILRPKFWTAQDPAGKFLDAIWLDPTITKFVARARKLHHYWDSMNQKESVKTIEECPSIIWHKKKSDPTVEKWLNQDSICWAVPKGDSHRLNTMVAALHIIWFLGFKQVYIIGADFNMSVENPYFFDENGKGRAGGNNSLYKLTNAFFDRMQPLFLERGFSVYNCTDGGDLTSFPRMSYADALKKTQIESTLKTVGSYASVEKKEIKNIIEGGIKKEILYYSHNIIDGSPLNDACRQSLLETGLPILSVTQQPIDLGRNIVMDLPKELGSMIRQIIRGLEESNADYIYFAEHDCIYHPSHFNILTGRVTYDTNMWRLCATGFSKHPTDKFVLSACMGPREVLLQAMKEKLNIYKDKEKRGKRRKYIRMIYEPGRGGGEIGRQLNPVRIEAAVPSIDIRHGQNSTQTECPKRWEHTDRLVYWGDAKTRRREFGL